MQGREQVVIFPFEIQHAAMLACLAQKHDRVTPISAGFVQGDAEKLWAGGESLTLELSSRPQDVERIRAFLASPNAEFNFITGGAQ